MRIVEKLKVDLKTLIWVIPLSLIIAAVIWSIKRGSIDLPYGIPIILVSLVFIYLNVTTRSKDLKKQIDDFLSSGLESERKNKWLTAVKFYDEALALDSKNAVALTGKARSYLGVSRREDAITAAKQALNIHPDSPVGHYLLGLAYFESRLLEDAEEHLLKAVSLKEDYPDPWLKLGDVGKQMNKTETKNYYKKFIELSSDEALVAEAASKLEKFQKHLKYRSDKERGEQNENFEEEGAGVD